MKQFLFLCFALLGFVFTSFGKSLDQLVCKNLVKDVSKEKLASIMKIVNVNSKEFIHVQNRIDHTEYESWRMCKLGYNKIATQIL